MPYGRLANPDYTLGTDPRSDPRMVATLKTIGLDGRLPLPPVDPQAEICNGIDDNESAIGNTESSCNFG